MNATVQLQSMNYELSLNDVTDDGHFGIGEESYFLELHGEKLCQITFTWVKADDENFLGGSKLTLIKPGFDFLVLPGIWSPFQLVAHVEDFLIGLNEEYGNEFFNEAFSDEEGNPIKRPITFVG